jgi:Bax protein
MKNYPAQTQTKNRAARRSRAWTVGVAGILMAGAAAAFVPPVQQHVAAILDQAGMVGMRKPSAILAFATPAKLSRHFASMGYDLDAVRKDNMPVPRLFLSKMPDGLSALKQSRERKAVFLRLMLPLVLNANERVLRQRAQLLVFDAKLAAGSDLSPDQQHRLEAIATEYRTDPNRLDLLLRRVDAVPPSLALAQAAIESGWGTSRFVREGNAAFGQWTSAKHKGIVPSGRDVGKSHKIRSFDHLGDSVRSYIHNLNTHRAYVGLRDMRTGMRSEGKRLAGHNLLPAMISYSEKKGAYLDLLRSVIRTNKLAPLDAARLSDKSSDV